MRIVEDLRKERLDADTAVAIGNFDGVHLGHRAVIGSMVRHAAQVRLRPAVLAFKPHPARLFASRFAPPLITSYDARAALIASMGVETLVEQTFDREFASTEPESFVATYLCGRMRARSVFVGFDFNFGTGGRGSVELLRDLGRRHGLFVDVTSQVRIEGMPVSSTRIREFVLEGNVAGAAKLLGRPFSMEGAVVRGLSRGKLLGFPTANLEGSTELMPAAGVYATFATVDGARRRAVTNVGNNPTFGAVSISVETHILDFDGELCGKRMVVEFMERLRDEKRFGSMAELAEGIKNDVMTAGRMLDGLI